MVDEVLSDRFIEVGGLRTRYREAGAGTPTLLIHGAPLGSSAEDWADVLGPLAEAGLRVIALDQPGYGLTDNPSDFTVDFRQNFFLDFLSALGIDRANWIGHSQAGGMVANIALMHSGRVSKAVIAATGSMLPPMPHQAKGATERDMEFTTDPTAQQVRQLLAGHVWNDRVLTPERVARYRELCLGKNLAFLKARRASDVSGVAKPANDIPFWKQLDKLPVPMRFIYGVHDRNHTAVRAALAIDYCPDADIQMVENAKHLIHWDAPEAFVSHVVRFL